MTFKKLILTNTWTSISSKFLELYPNVEKNIGGYEAVFKKMEVMPSEDTDMSIVITKEINDDEEYIDVSGLHNNPKNKEEKHSQGLELTPWQNWLGMEISEESLTNFSKEEIIVHCLHEMTYVGFFEEDIPNVNNRIKKKRQEIKSIIDEERYVSGTSIDELLRDCSE